MRVGVLDVGFAIEEISNPILKFLQKISTVSLVILFLRSFVTTSPIGDLLAKVLAESGFVL